MKTILIIAINFFIIINLYSQKKFQIINKVAIGHTWGFSEGLAKVENSMYEHYNVGFIDTTGNLVIDYQFVSAGSFNEGLCCVQGGENLEYGFINKKGELVIDYKYEWAGAFVEGLCAVKKYNKWGFINKKGEVVIDFIFDDTPKTPYFKEGLCAVKKDNKYGYINSKGQLVIEFIFKNAKNFHNGYAIVEVENDSINKYMIINKYGFPAVNERYNMIRNFDGKSFCVKKEGKFGFIDEFGNNLTSFEFEQTYGFKEGLCAVKKNNKWGFIDTSGILVINYQFDDAGIFCEGLCVVKKDSKWGFIDKAGNLVIKYNYDEVTSIDMCLGCAFYNNSYWNLYTFKDGYCPVKNNGKWGFIDSNGNLKIDYLFQTVYRFDISDPWIVEFQDKMKYFIKIIN